MQVQASTAQHSILDSFFTHLREATISGERFANTTDIYALTFRCGDRLHCSCQLMAIIEACSPWDADEKEAVCGSCMRLCAGIARLEIR